MKFSATAAWVVAAISLAACGGGSGATIANVSGNTSNLRIVNGVPGTTNYDIYYQSTGSAAPSQTIVSNLAYGTASDYTTQASTAGNVLVQTAGGGAPSTGTAQQASCPIPQMAINAKYSIVIVRASGVINCELFQDFDYTASPQYRVHDASPNSALAAGAGFGTEATPSAPPGSTFSVQVPAAQGALAAGASPATAYTAAQANPIAAFTGSITFAVSNQTSGSAPALATLDSRYIFSPNGTTQPNSSGALNFTGTAGTSIFALDCTTNVAPNVPCSGGVALVGFTDRL